MVRLQLPSSSTSILFCSVSLLFGCATEPGPAHGPDDLGQRDAGTDEDGGEDEACSEGQLEDCECDDGSTGRRRCTDGDFSSCRGCSGDESPAGNGSLCVPGHYQGIIDG